MAMEVPLDSLDVVREALKDETKLVYLVVANADSDCWAIGCAVEQEMAGILSIRLHDRASAQEWIKDSAHIAAVTDWAGNVRCELSAAQAEDKDFVLQELNKACGNG